MNKELADLGMWLGTDAVAFIKIRGFVEGLQDNPSPHSKEFLEALELVHTIFEKVVEND